MTLNDKTYKIPPYGRVNFIYVRTACSIPCRSLLLYTVIRPIPVPTRLHHQRATADPFALGLRPQRFTLEESI